MMATVWPKRLSQAALPHWCSVTNSRRGGATPCSGRLPETPTTSIRVHTELTHVTTRKLARPQATQPPHPADRPRRNDRCWIVSRLRPGHSRRRPRLAARLCARRCGHLFHHARARRAADVPPGGRLVRNVCG